MGTNTVEDIAHAIRQVIAVTLAKMPSARILLLGILPRAGDTEITVQAINNLIARFNDNKRIFFLDMSVKFQDYAGTEKAGLFMDTIHLTKAGYQIWYETMEPLLQRLLM